MNPFFNFIFAGHLCLILFGSPAHADVVSNEETKTVVLGDVEGSRERFFGFLNQSPAFEIVATSSKSVRVVRAGYKFVYLGDVGDFGDSTLEILNTIAEIRKFSRPNSVVTLMGNRDLNKYGLKRELSEEALQTVSQPFKLWWEEKRKNYPARPNSFWTTWYTDSNFEKDRGVRLRYILENKLGAPKAFDYRVQELSRRAEGHYLTDRDITRTFLYDITPDGPLTGYNRSSELLHFDQGYLFAHGVVREDNFLRLAMTENFSPDVGSWIAEQNSWANKMLQFVITGDSKGSELTDYIRPLAGSASNSKSVVYGRFLDSNGKVIPISKTFAEALKKNHIHTIIVGHTPVGDYPVILEENGIRIVMADLSKSSHGNSAQIEIDGPTIRIRGKLRFSGSNGRYKEIVTEHTYDKHRSAVGTRTSNGIVIIDDKGVGKIEYTYDPSSQKVSYRKIPNCLL